MTPGSRSPILDVGARAVFHTVLVVALYLLFSGHNAPGGGFVAGLVAGAAFVLVDAASAFDPAARRGRLPPEALLGGGLAFAAATGLASLAVGGAFLESDLLRFALPGLGTVKATSALVFDIGVFLLVLGMVLAIVDRLGEEPE
jgi:multicomponent Na+:H+ antiporter subunit A